MSRPWTMLALPGLGLDEASWAPTLTALPAGHTTLVRSLPGYGDAASPGRPTDPRRLAADLRGQAPEGRVVVLAHSASCQIAAHMAAGDPAGVAGLVLVGPTTDPRAATWPRLATRWLATARHESPRQVPSLVRQYRRTTLRTMAVAMDAARHDRIVRTLRETPVPVLVVRGRHDRICPEDWAGLVAGCGGTGSRALTLPGGAHMVPLTHGPLVAAAIVQFLGDAVEQQAP